MIVYNEPKNIEAFMRWRTDSGYAYNIWYQEDDIVHLRRSYHEQDLDPELIDTLEKCEEMIKNRRDFPDYYPVKYAQIEFIYKDKFYILTPDTLGIEFEFDFEVSRNMLQEKLRGIGVQHSKYSGMLD